MKKQLFFLPLLLALLMGACSKDDSQDAAALLETVPADADFALIIKPAAMARKAGCKVSQTAISLPENLRKEMDAIPNTAARSRVEGILEGKAGVALNALCIFGSRQAYATGLLDNPSDFKQFVEKNLGDTFTSEEGVNVCGSFAYVGNQFWIALQGNADGTEIARYPKLSKSQSFAGKEESELIIGSKEDLACVANLNSLLGTYGRNRAQISLAMSAAFDNASALFVSADTSDKGLTLTAQPVGDNGKPAKFLLPTATIDVKTVASLQGNGSVVMAAAIPKALVKKFTDLLSSFGGGLPQPFVEALADIDGTMAFTTTLRSMRGIVSLSKTPSPQLVELVGNISGSVVTVQGKSLLLSQGSDTPAAPLNPTDVASRFKGAMIGVASVDLPGTPDSDSQSAPAVYVKAVPDNNSVRIQADLELGKSGWPGILRLIAK